MKDTFGPTRLVELIDFCPEKRDPILDRLENESCENQADSDDTHEPFRHVIRGPLDERHAKTHDSRYHANHQSDLQPEGERARLLMAH
jgi:hypothetical protein